jgi:hypothetical protein
MILGDVYPTELIEEIGQRAKGIYNSKYRAEYEARYYGKFLAIDTETERVFLSDTEDGASLAARNARPGSLPYLFRIGFEAVYRI